MQEVVIKNGKFPQYTSIAHPPPILQIQVQRVQYDVQNKKTYKSEAHLRLRKTIYLDRYMDRDEDDEEDDRALLERRRESWRWKEELRRLETKRQALLKTEVSGLTAFASIRDAGTFGLLHADHREGRHECPERVRGDKRLAGRVAIS